MEYTYEEEKLILKTAKELGYDNPLTWKGLAKKLNRNHPRHIKSKYDKLIAPESTDKKRLTKKNGGRYH